MEIPSVSDPIWGDLLIGKINREIDFLALKILLARLRLSVKNDSSKDNINKCSQDIHNFFIKWSHVPSANNDLEKIINGRSS